MKKNLVFKLGLFCAALVLIATCFVSSAWAKYTKTVSATDSARVAKFVFDVRMGQNGAETQINGDSVNFDIFTTDFEEIYQDSNNKNVAGKKLVAPGSKGQFDVEVTNGSEVDVNVKYTAIIDNPHNVPIVFSTDPSFATKTSDLGSLLVAHELDCGQAGQSLANTYTIYWMWNTSSDAADTALGELAAGQELVINVTIKVTVEQIVHH